MNKFFKFLVVPMIAISMAFGTFVPGVDAIVKVKGYYRSDGTYVRPHVRSNPNGVKYDNYSYRPSQGKYNKTYGTRGSAWDTPTYITDPDYYEGERCYDTGCNPFKSSTTTASGSTYTSYKPKHKMYVENGNYYYFDSSKKLQYISSLANLASLVASGTVQAGTEQKVGHYVPHPSYLSRYRASQLIHLPNGMIFLKPGYSL